MTAESQYLDLKSLRTVTGKTADWPELAKDCVCFANARGGKILIGIEDGQTESPTGQILPAGLAEKIMKRIGELTVNVTLSTQIRVSDNGGEYLEITVARSNAPASTTDGRFYLRIADNCKPLVGSDIQRLLDERNAQPWETLTTLKVPRKQVDTDKFSRFVTDIRASDRVKTSVKEKSDPELLDHYLLAADGFLTNLGILCVGRRQDRAMLGTAPVIQFLKFDENHQKVNKIVWDDYSLTPMELIEAVWQEIPDFREQYELPAGLFRTTLAVYDEVVVRELMVNALVHRPYTQRGDIFLNLRTDCLEVVNPGLLPLGVTPRNVLHTTVRRNEHLARVFHDLKLMEREGSGFDRMYEVLLSQARPVPELREGPDRVEVIIRKRILKPEIIEFISKADQTWQLNQRERITLGLLAQHESLTARELSALLELDEIAGLSSWMGRLQKIGVVQQKGKTQATRYFVNPHLLRKLDFTQSTTLSLIEPYRLKALILEDLRRYPDSAISDIHHRVAPELDRHRMKQALEILIKDGLIVFSGEKRWRRYSTVD
ncbi:MAG: putative DNA binding domain-containing protein [Desulfobulbaceae bacterium]|jgi:ATP-dependent DNA helicase RecG|nr:putative DNA binding domain-containing protein [Desulfobulbaceae bacterium]